MTRNEKIILAMLISSASVMASFISPELTLIKQFFSLANKELTQVMTTYLAGYLLGQVLWAFVANKIGCVASIKYGLGVSILGALFIIVAMRLQLYSLFLAGRALLALGLASGLVCGFALIKENLQDEEHKQYLSAIAIVFTASIYFSILLSGCLAKYTSLDFVMYCVLFYNLALFYLCLYIKDNHAFPMQHRIKKADNWMGIKSLSKVIVFSLMLSITTIISYGYAMYAPIISSELYGLTPAEFGFFSLINMPFIFLGSKFYLKLVKNITLIPHLII